MRHERDISNIRLAVRTVNRDQTSTIAQLRIRAERRRGQRPKAARTHGRSAAQSVDAAEHRYTIHARWPSDLRRPGGEIKPTIWSRNPRAIAPNDRLRIAAKCAPDCRVDLRPDPKSIVYDIGVRDPVTDPGVRVPVPEVGSLTSRLLSATLSASAKIAVALRSNPRGSPSANFRRVFSYAYASCSRRLHDRADRRTDTPRVRGEMVPPAPSPPPPPPYRCVRYFANA